MLLLKFENSFLPIHSPYLNLRGRENERKKEKEIKGNENGGKRGKTEFADGDFE